MYYLHERCIDLNSNIFFSLVGVGPEMWQEGGDEIYAVIIFKSDLILFYSSRITPKLIEINGLRRT